MLLLVLLRTHYVVRMLQLVFVVLPSSFGCAAPRWERTKLALQTASTLGLYWPYKFRAIHKNCERVNRIGLLESPEKHHQLIQENCQLEFGCVMRSKPSSSKATEATEAVAHCMAAPISRLYRKFSRDVRKFCRGQPNLEACVKLPVCYRKEDRCFANVAYAFRRAEQGYVGLSGSKVAQVPSFLKDRYLNRKVVSSK